MSTHSILPQASSNAFARPAHSLHDLLQRAIGAAYAALLLWNDRQTQRHHLSELDDHQLRDMGLSKEEVWQEAQKPFWRR